MSPIETRAVVVDTDVVSYLFKSDTRAELYRPHLSGRQLLLSFMSLAELYRWALRRNWGESRRQRLDGYLRNFTVPPFDRALCRRWSEVTEAVRRDGRAISTADAWIAATALLYDLPLVTHNANDFAAVPALTVMSAAE